MIVVKVGGEVVDSRAACDRFAEDVRAARAAGQALVVVHGGGPQASRLQERLGLVATRVRGQRVTDPETLEVVKMALAGQAALDLQAALVRAGVPAVALSGVGGGLLTAVRRGGPESRLAGAPDADLGLVGEIVSVDTRLVAHVLEGGWTPCVSSLAVGRDGQIYNVNADAAAAAIAAALGARSLLLLTGANGVRRDAADPASRIGRMTVAEARALIAEGAIREGMIPKVEEAAAALAAGVASVQIASGLEAGAWPAEVADPGSVGTVIVP